MSPPSRAEEASAARRLLARLREELAAGTTPLPKLVALVAGGMNCDVCSLYVVRPGELLELTATFGLDFAAVGATRLRIGEGVVGLVAAMAAPLNLADAQGHPAFAHRPETGEAAFASLLALPIRRSGHVIGVITVQSRLTRGFTEIEVEALETVAMLLAEMLAVQGAIAVRHEGIGDALPRRFQGVALASGLVMGGIIRLQPRLTQRQMLAPDPAAERLRLAAATERLQHGLDELALTAADSQASEILAAYRLVASDDGWMRRAADLIETGLSAEAAIMRVMTDLRDRMRRISDPYLRERLVDIEDVGNRLMAQLASPLGTPVALGDCRGMILVARRLGPAELLDWARRGIGAVAVEEGSAAGHAAILARSMGLPSLAGVRGLMDAARDSDLAILDAEEGLLVLRPEEAMQQAYGAALASHRMADPDRDRLAHLPSVSHDGVAVSLMLNLGLPLELRHLEETGAAGIGLYRTEIALLARDPESLHGGTVAAAVGSGGIAAGDGMRLPDGAGDQVTIEQIAEYRRVLDQAGDRPVLFRTLDLGGDKLLVGDAPPSENPAMGWRSLRVGLDRPAIMRRQLRAFLKAAAGRPLSIMFPMVATVAEFRAARGLLMAEVARAAAPPSQLQVGTMLEVPALLWQLDELMAEVDFVSIGSNDLMQFLFAADRGTPNLMGRYDLLSQPVLDILDSVLRAAAAHDVALSFCGEAAGRPLDALALAALGFRSLSMSPSSLLRVKAALRAADLTAVAGVLRSLRDRHNGATSLREPLSLWAREHDITV